MVETDPRIIGTAAEALVRGHSAGSLVRIRRGAHVDAADWERAFPEQRARVAAEALLRQARGAPIVFSHVSAAAYWGLPLYRTRVDRVHVVQAHARASSTVRVMRHADRVREDDVTWLAEGTVGVTSLARTVFDLIRALRAEAALALMDAALRSVARSDTDRRALDLDAAESLRQELAERIRGAVGARGVRQAREMVESGDARAESVGESVSRLYLRRIGFHGLGLQVRVPGPSGRDYEVDFDLGPVWGEFDGDVKYRDPYLLRGRTPTQVVADEKAREDWIRATTGKRFVRWGFAHLSDERALAERLSMFGVTPPHAPRPHLHSETTSNWM